MKSIDAINITGVHGDTGHIIHLNSAEVVAAAATMQLAAAIVLAYFSDLVGIQIAPLAILALSVAAAAAVFARLRRAARWDARELLVFTTVVASMFAWLLWIARPALLPLGRGPDLTHHLLLIDYIDRHWQLVHDPRLEAYLGEMIHYTPGSHLLASLAGAWTRTDGFHAVHAVTAWTVALKTGVVFLVSLRLLPRTVTRIPIALTSVLLLFLARAYFLGSFTHDSFFSQVVSELFAVTMWWLLVVWDERPWSDAMMLFALAGTAAFLTWPVLIGPPMLALLALVSVREGLSIKQRVEQLIVGAGPILVVAAIYIAGRAGWILMVRASGAALRPWPSVIGWGFLLLSAAGLALAITERRTRATMMLLAAIGVQAAALFVLAKANGADTPYMALKMFYLAVYPLAVLAAVAAGVAWQAAMLMATGHRPLEGGHSVVNPPVSLTATAWVVVALLAIAVARQLAAAPRATPVVSEGAYRAGQWARAHVPPSCVDYLMADGDAAYWLHLALLGNPRMAARTGAADTFDPHKAIVRWIMPRGLTFAIAEDFERLPKDIQTNVDVLARFGRAAVIKRRGDSSCPE